MVEKNCLSGLHGRLHDKMSLSHCPVCPPEDTLMEQCHKHDSHALSEHSSWFLAPLTRPALWCRLTAAKSFPRFANWNNVFVNQTRHNGMLSPFSSKIQQKYCRGSRRNMHLHAAIEVIFAALNISSETVQCNWQLIVNRG